MDMEQSFSPPLYVTWSYPATSLNVCPPEDALKFHNPPFKKPVRKKITPPLNKETMHVMAHDSNAFLPLIIE